MTTTDPRCPRGGRGQRQPRPVRLHRHRGPAGRRRPRTGIDHLPELRRLRRRRRRRRRTTTPSSTPPSWARPSYMFEPLMIVETYSCERDPLAGHRATSGPTRRPSSSTLRDGVKWNDGEPFTAEDVAFTFNMLKEHAGAGPPGRLAVPRLGRGHRATTRSRSRSTQPGRVGVHADQRASRSCPSTSGREVDDPVDVHQREDPVGTGPMKVKSFNPQQLVIERNPDYWQADKVKVQEIRFHKADARWPDRAAQAQPRRVRHQRDVRARHREVLRQPRPGAQPLLVPAGRRRSAVYMNLTKAPFDDVEFRRALTTAFNQRRDHRQGAARLRRARPARPASWCPARRSGCPRASRTRA